MSRAARVAAVAAVSFIWGSTWLAIKIGLEFVPPFLSAGMRFALAAAILCALSWARGIPLPRRGRTHAGLLALGILNFIVNYGAVYWGEQYVSSGLTAVLFATYPLFVLLIAHLALGTERITPRRALGVLVGFAGVAIIFRSDLAVYDPRAALAVGVILISPVVSAVTSVAIKRWGHDLHPYTLTALPMTYGAVGLTAIGLTVESPRAIEWTPAAIGSITYLAVFGSVVAFVIYYRLLKVVPVSLLALVSYAFPVVAVALGWLVLDERLAGSTLLGAGAVLAGIVLATWRRRPPRVGPPDPALGGLRRPASPTDRRAPT
ncbi:MAG TPA: EamA family transporter [Gemmatimonadota bacterium]|nr:EamA family transporter [Gemmatimonadota bacterium]